MNKSEKPQEVKNRAISKAEEARDQLWEEYNRFNDINNIAPDN